MPSASANQSTSGFDPRSFLITWGPFVLLLGLLTLAYRGLFAFTTISPLNEGPLEDLASPLFVPNQKSPEVIFGLAVVMSIVRFTKMRPSIGVERPTRSSLPLLVIGLFVLIWSHYTREAALGVVSLSMTLLGAAGLLGGISASRAMRLPALFLLLMIPIPGVLLNSIVFHLQQVTAHMTGFVLSVLGIDHIVSGDMIYTGTSAFQVIEGCSGLRAIETLIMTAIVYQEWVPHSRLYSWILVATAPIFAIATNLLRVLSIVLDPTVTQTADHTIQGIVMIIVGAFMVMGFASVLTWCLPGSPIPNGGGSISDEIDEGSAGPNVRKWPINRLATVVIVLLLCFVSTLGETWKVARPEHKNPVLLPAVFGEWRSETDEIDQEFLGSTRFTQTVSRTYRRGNETVTVFVGVDARSKPLLSGISPRTLMLGRGWEAISRAPRSIDGFATTRATESIQRRLNDHAYVLHWRQGTDPYWQEAARNAIGLDRSPWQRPYSSTDIRISTPLRKYTRDHEAEARTLIEPFVDLVRATFPMPGDTGGMEGSSAGLGES